MTDAATPENLRVLAFDLLQGHEPDLDSGIAKAATALRAAADQLEAVLRCE